MAMCFSCDSIFVFITACLVNDVLSFSEYRYFLQNGDNPIYRFFHIRSIRSLDNNTNINLTSSEKVSTYNVSSKNQPRGGTECFNDSHTATNGTFYCPQPGESPDFTACCGNKNQQTCCKPKPPPKQHDATLDLITALSIVIGFIVAISCCLLLYCCCCQKRSGVHSGKLVWIKKKKSGNKTVYTASDNPDLDDDQEGTELVGFIEQREENGIGSRKTSIIDSIKESESRRGSKSSADHHKHHHHHHHKSEEDVPVVKHVTPSGQVLMVPLINIQGSTPGTSPC